MAVDHRRSRARQALARGADVFRREERLEHAIAHGLGNSRAGVAEADLDAAAPVLRLDADRGAACGLPGRLGRVADEREDGLADLADAARHRRDRLERGLELGDVLVLAA